MTHHRSAGRPPRRRGAVVWSSAAILGLVLAGCAPGKDAVATGGSFDFVAPGGQTVIAYDPPAAAAR